jgi:hypothetical protein
MIPEIPQEILERADPAELQLWSRDALGSPMVGKYKWENAVKTVQKTISQLKKKEKQAADAIRFSEKKNWPWLEGYKFFCDGPNPRQNMSCYLTDTARGVEIFVSEEKLSNYLDSKFVLPPIE